MKQFIFVLMILIMATAETVKPTDACACDEILSQADCQANKTCAWTVPVANIDTTEAPGSCGTSAAPTAPANQTEPPSYCLSITDPEKNCWRTFGCAYVDSKCTHFTGCSAYVKTTSLDCQAISKQCITDGTQCTKAKSCNEYITEIECTQNVSISGSSKCKWENNICRDEICTEANTSLNTDVLCDSWLTGCLTTGRGCTASLGLCNSYTGDDITCDGLIGSDGFCRGTPGGTNCSSRECSEAPMTLVSNRECENYQSQCVTNGKGCIAYPQPPCNSFLGDKTTCFGYIGSDGYCEGDVGATNCRTRACTDAPTSYNTKEFCNKYKEGCVTTGRGCIATQHACSGYSGTSSSCLGYIGTDGQCKGVRNIPGPCTPKLCTEADNTLMTNEDCNRFQMNCVTTGKGCVAKESQLKCEAYSGDITTCEGLIGIDGKCKGTINGIQCSVKLCSEAPPSADTNLLCSQFQIGCVTNGRGCIEMQSCLNSIQQVSCEGNSDCGWKSTCVANTSCNSFTTPSMCSNNQAITSENISIPCFWSSGSCRDLKCEDAPLTYNTDTQCKQFWAQCLTNSKGCLHISAPCSYYQGTQITCSNYSRKCWNLISVISETASCLERQCTDNTISQSDSVCEAFLSGCRTNGAGCISETSLCSDYKGTRESCDHFYSILNGKTTRCYNIQCSDQNTSCTNKKCSDNDTFTLDSECETFLSGCLTNGKGCIDSSLDCSHYSGTQQECAKFRGNHGSHICWNVSSALTVVPCNIKECTDASSDLKSDLDCKVFLSSCVTNGHGCISEYSPCSSYIDTSGECSNFTGNGMKCYNNYACTTRSCEDVTNPLNNYDCTHYLSICRLFKDKCVDAKTCNSYAGTKLSDCQEVYDNTSPTPQKCWWENGSYCTQRTCLNAPLSVCQLNCDSHILGCVYNNFKSRCQILDNCNTYTADSGTVAWKQYQCSYMKTFNNQFCGYSSDNPNFCSPRSCTNVLNPTNLQDCNDYLLNLCQFNGSKCINKGVCTDYKKSDMNLTILNSDALIKAQCETMTSNDGSLCTFQDGGSTCKIKSQICITSIEQKCKSKTNATSAADCIAVDYGCRFNGNSTCITEQLNCNTYNIDTLYSSQSQKEAVCNWLTNSVGEQCKYISGTYCSAKECSDKIDALSYVDCRAIKSTCRWVGGVSVCVEANNDCGYTLFSGANANDICPTLFDNSGNSCIADSGDPTRCKAKLCSAKIGATNQSDCMAHKPSCKWVGGTTCVEARTDCKYIVTGDAKSVCVTLTDSMGNTCFADSATTCKIVLCSMKTNAYFQSDCKQFKPSCKWVGGPTCVETKNDCDYQLYSPDFPIEFQNFICSSLTDTYGRQCTVGINGNCRVKPICSEKVDAHTQADCLHHYSNCRWLGGSICVEANYDCYYTQVTNSEVTCLTLTDMFERKCMAETSGNCKAKPIVCSEAIDAHSQVDCLSYQYNCRWLGGSTCVGANQDCYYTQVTDSEVTCLTLTDMFQRKCMAGTSGNCKAKPIVCSEAIDAHSQVDCLSYYYNCRWLGGSSCVEANQDCYYTQVTDSEVTCLTLTNIFNRKCMAGTSGNCKAKPIVCSEVIDAHSQADCQIYYYNCRWLGGSSCVEANQDCYYTQVTDSEVTCLTLTNIFNRKCVAGTSGNCKAKPIFCSEVIDAHSQADCLSYYYQCRWLGGSTCVEANQDCYYTQVTDSEVTCLTLTNIFNRKCMAGTSGNCKAKPIVCSEVIDAHSQADCQYQNYPCRWLGGSSTTCVDAFDFPFCSFTINDNELISTFCPTLKDSNGNPCVADTGQKCKAQECSEAVTATHQAACQSVKPSCMFVGNSGCVDVNDDCTYTVSFDGMCWLLSDSIGNRCVADSGQLCMAKLCSDKIATNQNDCIQYKPTCRWIGGTTACVEANYDCNYTITPGESIFNICPNLTSLDWMQCIAYSGQQCRAKACSDITNATQQSDCTTYLYNCRWVGGTSTCVEANYDCNYTITPGESIHSVCPTLSSFYGDNCLPDSGQWCRAKRCSDITNATQQSDCTTYLYNCRWVGGTSTCVVANFNCNYIITPGESIHSVCPTLSSFYGHNCLPDSGQWCRAKRCSEITNATQQSDCTSFLYNCKWVGGTSTCVEANFNCNYIITPGESIHSVCPTLSSFYGDNCLPDSGQWCRAKRCSDITNATQQSDCTTYLYNCRWVGGTSTCVEANYDCNYTITPGESIFNICPNLTSLDWMQCMAYSGQQCRAKACSDITNATQQSDCTTYLYNCRWVGGTSTCVEANYDCNYTITPGESIHSVCPTISQYNDQIFCYAGFGQQCRTIRCSDITNATQQSDCKTYLYNCRWIGGTTACVEANYDCNYIITPGESIHSVCPTLSSFYGDNCLPDSGQWCRAKRCSDITNATQQSDCTTYLYNCRWVGGTSTCVQEELCQYYKLSNEVVAANICSTLTDYLGNSCIAGQGLTCAYSCANIQNFIDVFGCISKNCRWLGGTSCDDIKSDCAQYSVIGTNQQSICDSLTDSNGNQCQYSGAGQTCKQASAKSCAERDLMTVSLFSCYLQSDCILVEMTCQDLKADCSYTVTSTSGQQTICEGLYDPLRNPCQYSGSGQLCQARTCFGNKVATSNQQCKTWKSDCELAITGIGCVDPFFCNENQNIVRTCENIPKIPTCAVDCIEWSQNCRFTGINCVLKNICEMYIVSQGDTNNFYICNSLTDTNDNRCTFEIGASKTVCKPRLCSDITDTRDNCTQYKTSCQWTGSVCVDQTTCDSYRVSTLDDPTTQATNCRSLIDFRNNIQCGYASSGICTSRTCTNITPLPNSDIMCTSYLNNCLFSRLTKTTTSCIDQQAPCTQYFGTATECKKYLGMGKTQPCWSIQSDDADPMNCIPRTCEHNTTAISNLECDLFLKTCRTKGIGCVPISTDCSSFSGDEGTCANFLAKNSTIDHCKVVTVKVPSPCKVRTCQDDGKSITDVMCDTFLKGCVTNGQGCVPSTMPCTYFQGDQTICNQFIGNSKRCWNTNPKISNYCFDKKCSDDTTSTTDVECFLTQKVCVTKGIGCIENTAPCSSYQGSQSHCSMFRGNKNILCWNTIDAIHTSPCKDKKCTDNTLATTNADCNAFLPSLTSTTIPQCVSKGIGCVDYGKPCSFFTGTEQQCSSFIATDGPCKTKNITLPGTCTPRICSEALNTLNTNAQCQAYHPSCATNGYGCILSNSVTCSSIQVRETCAASTGCAWVNNCSGTFQNCSDLTQSGPSLCVNTKVSTGKCAWNGTTCRQQTCEDLPASLVTHIDCNNIIDTCTTTGSGCITKSTCSSYLTEIICKSAKTTDIGDFCIWDTDICRIKVCTDGQLTSDIGCGIYLAGCKTNGISCIPDGFNCEVFQTATTCQKDSFSKPCLFVNNKCYNYSKCEDIPLKTHTECQKVSPLCTTTGDKCIPITTCSKTTLMPSCVIGTDGTCGWLPTAKCQKFGSCSDAIASDTTICQAYGIQCITDGTNCVDKSLCSTYLTEIACKQGGTNGICFFEQNTCRLRECKDATTIDANITSVSECQAFNARTECTTNGTSCIALPSCATYTIEERCTRGVDGLCIYDLPLGQTTGTKECRLKACGDFQYDNNNACTVALTGAGVRTGCVSDGKVCIAKAACATYTSKEACNGGGSDGLCAFTQGSSTTPLIGTCKFMTSCIDANNDSLACLAKQDVCNWTTTIAGTTTTTACSSHTCATKSSGSTCVPVPSYDLLTYTVCGPSTNGGCEEVQGSTLLETTCQSQTVKTYTWNEITNECTACFITKNNTVPDEDQIITTQTTDGNVIKTLAILVISAIMVA